MLDCKSNALCFVFLIQSGESRLRAPFSQLCWIYLAVSQGVGSGGGMVVSVDTLSRRNSTQRGQVKRNLWVCSFTVSFQIMKQINTSQTSPKNICILQRSLIFYNFYKFYVLVSSLKMLTGSIFFSPMWKHDRNSFPQCFCKLLP